MTNLEETKKLLLESLGRARNFGQEGQIIKSVEEYDNTIKTAESVNDLRTAAMVCIEAGLLLTETDVSGVNEETEFNPQEKAISFYKKGLKFSQKAKDVGIETDVHFNLAFSYLNIKKFSNALSHAQEALSQYQKANNSDGLPDAQFAVALSYDGLEDTPKAILAYKKALKLYEKNENLEGVLSVSINLGHLYSKEEDHEKAIKQFKLVVATAHTVGDLASEGDALGWIGEIYDELEKTPQASKYYVNSAERYIEGKLFDQAKQNLDIVESGLSGLPKATRRRLRNLVWDLKAKLPKDLLSKGT
ncbi:MAG: tetratricopeptide repeat protein [Candidatus Ranarchaeia archaeon]|jgi:tetratricopeptide (TPR) repeat protein